MTEKNRSDSLKRFASGIAHDINNILTGVMGFTQLILMEMKEDDRLYNEIKEIETSAKRGKKLTDKLLSYGQEISLLKKPSDIGSIIKEAVQETRDLVKSGISITTELTEAPSAELDSEKIKEALRGLILNSAGAIESNGEVKVKIRPEEGRTLIISIDDSGRGAEPEDLPFLFEPLYQTKKMRRTSIDSAIACEILKKHGGQIKVSLNEAGGIRTEIRLPLVQE